MQPQNTRTVWDIARSAIPGIAGIVAATEWGGAGPGKLLVGLLTFVIVYALLRSWHRS